MIYIDQSQMSIEIQSEIKHSNGLLDEIDSGLANAQAMVKRAMKKLKIISETSSMKHYVYLVMFIFVVIFVLYILIRYVYFFFPLLSFSRLLRVVHSLNPE